MWALSRRCAPLGESVYKRVALFPPCPRPAAAVRAVPGWNSVAEDASSETQKVACSVTVLRDCVAFSPLWTWKRAYAKHSPMRKPSASKHDTKRSSTATLFADMDALEEEEQFTTSLVELEERESTPALPADEANTEVSSVPPPRARYVAASASSVAKELQRRVAGTETESLLRTKFDLDEPSPETRADIHANAERMTALLTMPTAPAVLQRRARVAVLSPDERDVHVYAMRHGESLHALTRYARALAEEGCYEEAEAALDYMRSHGLSPDAAAYSAVLVAYARATSREAAGKMAERARELLQRMRAEATPVQLTPHLVSSFVTVLCADLPASAVGSAALDAAFELVEQLRTHGKGRELLSIETYTSLIKGCVRVRDYKRAWSTFDHVRIWHQTEPRMKLDAVVYSLMIHVCAMTGEAERALNLFDEMRELGLTPTEVTFTALVGAFRFRPDLHAEALHVLRDMKGAGYAPDSRTLLTLLAVVSAQGDHTTAELLFDELRRIALDPATQAPLQLSQVHWRDVYQHLIGAYARAQRRPGIARTKRASELIVKAEALWARAKEHLASLGTQVDIHVANAMLRVYMEAGRLQRGLKWRDDIRNGSLALKDDVRDSFETRKLVLGLLSRCRRIERALDELQLLRVDGYVPDVQCYSFVISACARSRYVSTGMRLLREMHSLGLPLQPHHYYVLQFRRILVKTPHLIREIDSLTGKARQYVPGWKRPGGRKYKARMREISKTEAKRLAAEPAWLPVAQTHAVSGSAGR